MWSNDNNSAMIATIRCPHYVTAKIPTAVLKITSPTGQVGGGGLQSLQSQLQGTIWPVSTPQCLPRAQVASSQQSAVIIPYKQCRHSQPHQPTLPCWSQHVAAKTSGLGENKFKWNYNNKELIRVFACLWSPHSEHFSGAPRNLVSLHLSSRIWPFSLKSYIWNKLLSEGRRSATGSKPVQSVTAYLSIGRKQSQDWARTRGKSVYVSRSAWAGAGAGAGVLPWSVSAAFCRVKGGASAQLGPKNSFWTLVKFCQN